MSIAPGRRRLACLFARESGLATLDALAADGRWTAACLVTHAFEPDGRTPRPEFPRYEGWAGANGVPLHRVERGRRDLSFLRDYSFDFLVSVCYKFIVPDECLRLAAVAPLNIHRSLLPKHPGLKPLEKALRAGDKEAGLTIHRMTAEVDAGEILGQASVPIQPGDTVASLFQKIYPLHGPLLLGTLEKLEAGRQAGPAKR